MVSAPRNVDDADTIEPYALEKQFNVHSEGDSDFFTIVKVIISLKRRQEKVR